MDQWESGIHFFMWRLGKNVEKHDITVTSRMGPPAEKKQTGLCDIIQCKNMSMSMQQYLLI